MPVRGSLFDSRSKRRQSQTQALIATNLAAMGVLTEISWDPTEKSSIVHM